ncbi:MAG: VTT domain-containing protein [Actinomycetota bacterium]
MKRIVAFVVVLALAVAVVVSGLGEQLTDVDEVESFLRDRGWVGPVVFVVVMWTLQPLGVPGVAFMVPAALVWPAPAAMALSWIGNMGASFVAFGFARWIARDWAQVRLPDRLRAWDARLAVGGIRQVTVLRIFTGQLTPADWLLGVSSVRLRPFLIGTGIGIVPLIVIVVLAGASVGEWLFAEPVRWVPVAVAAVVGAGISRVLARRRAVAAAR